MIKITDCSVTSSPSQGKGTMAHCKKLFFYFKNTIFDNFMILKTILSWPVNINYPIKENHNYCTENFFVLKF